MVKKSKESLPQESEQNPNIFNKLFAGTPVDDESKSTSISSLFSLENPFRRKPDEKPPISSNPIPTKRNNEQDPIQSLPDSLEKGKKSGASKSVKNPNLGNENEAELNEKKKRTKEKSPNLAVEDTPEKGKKLKVEKLGKNPNLGKGNGVELDEKKKKRKRDELERDYEEKKYGALKEVDKEKEKVKVGKKRKAVDNPVELTAVSKEGEEEEGYDDESKLLRTVFVGNLPLKVKKKGLLKEFSQFGEIASVRIRSVPTLDSKKPKKAMIYKGKLNEAADSVHAYIVFKTEQEAEASLAHNMSVVEGNHIRVDRACPPRKKLKGESASTPLYSSKRTVFVGNLPFDVKDEELYQLFCGIKELESSIEAVRVIRDHHTSLGKGIAYVMFKTREAANLVCKKRKLKIRDRELRISHAKSETTPSKTNESITPSKRKADPPADSESTPAKKFSPGARAPRGRYKISSTQGDTSYQGFQASKSGEKKRTPSRTPSRTSNPTPFKVGIKKGENVKQRSEKRPSVLARKAKALGAALKSRGVSKQGGNKRKMDARTPPSSNHQNKKFRKSK